MVGFNFRLSRILRDIKAANVDLRDRCRKETLSFRTVWFKLSWTKPNFVCTLPRYLSAFTGENESILYAGTRDKTNIAPFDKVVLRCTKASSYNHCCRKCDQVGILKFVSVVVGNCKFSFTVLLSCAKFFFSNLYNFFSDPLVVFTICDNCIDGTMFSVKLGLGRLKSWLIRKSVKLVGVLFVTIK